MALLSNIQGGRDVSKIMFPSLCILVQVINKDSLSCFDIIKAFSFLQHPLLDIHTRTYFPNLRVYSELCSCCSPEMYTGLECYWSIISPYQSSFSCCLTPRRLPSYTNVKLHLIWKALSFVTRWKAKSNIISEDDQTIQQASSPFNALTIATFVEYGPDSKIASLELPSHFPPISCIHLS